MKLYAFGPDLYVSRWVGRHPVEDAAAIAAANIDVIFCLCKKQTDVHTVSEYVELVYHPIPDKRVGIPPLDDLRVIVSDILARLAEGKVVLVHCIEGRNRSILAAALVERKRNGWTGLQAWEHATIIRPHCLNNTAFAEWLRELP